MIQMNGKVIVNFGDSIFGNMEPPNDISSILAKLTGATVYNCAFGGCRMSRHAEHWDALSMYSLAEAVATGDFSYQDSIPMDELIEQGEMLDYFPKRKELLKKIDFNKVDIVTIAFGTNDYTARKRIATVKTDNVVALPAMQSNRNVLQLCDGSIGIDTQGSIFCFCCRNRKNILC